MANDIINAVKRLERAGGEQSKMTQKLVAAANTLLGVISARMIPVVGDAYNKRAMLPVGVARQHGLETFGDTISCRDWSAVSLPLEADRYLALRLGEAVAGGLMQDLASWMEERLQSEVSAASMLDRAAIPPEAP